MDGYRRIEMKKIAVFFPGIGYTVDKPLLYYSRRLVSAYGYEVRLLPYSGFPDKVKGDKERMRRSFEIARSQSRSMMADLDLGAYGEILFIGKSVGAVVAAAIASESREKSRIRLILYTPLEDTFSFGLGDGIVFTGSADPWVGRENSQIPVLCRERGIPCCTYPDADHSLETGDIQTDLAHMGQIMEKTKGFIEKGGC